MSEVEETIKRLSTHKGVEGIVITNMEGIPIRTTLDSASTIQHAALITQLTAKAKSVIRDLDPTNDLSMCLLLLLFCSLCYSSIISTPSNLSLFCSLCYSSIISTPSNLSLEFSHHHLIIFVYDCSL